MTTRGKNEVALRCEVCGHKWLETITLPMDLDAAAARFKAWAICPNCGQGGPGKRRGKPKVYFQ